MRASWPRRPTASCPTDSSRRPIFQHSCGVNGEWIAPREPRMDSGLVLDRAGVIWVREGRRIRRGDLVAVGDKEDGSQGIFVQTQLVPAGPHDDSFAFMSSEVSREKPIDYSHMAGIADRAKGAGRISHLGDGARAGSFARARRHELVHRQRVCRRAARRQCCRRARHRGVDLRHHPRDDQYRRDHAGGPWVAHARHQSGARSGFHRRSGRSGDHH